MKKKKPYFNLTEKEILKTLNRTNRAMTIRELAIKANVSWVTARKYLAKLRKEGFVCYDGEHKECS